MLRVMLRTWRVVSFAKGEGTSDGPVARLLNPPFYNVFTCPVTCCQIEFMLGVSDNSTANNA